VLVIVAIRGGSAQSTEAALRVLAEARTALGGEARLAAVKTLVAIGRTRQLRGDNIVAKEFDIQIELPSKYARRDEFPAEDTDPAIAGFDGDRLIQIPTPVFGPGGPTTQAQRHAIFDLRLAALKQDFACWMLGLFAASFDAFPLTFSYVGQAEAPQGIADVLGVTGDRNFSAQFYVDRATHLPLMLSRQVLSRGGRGGTEGGGAIEQRTYFADYRSVAGVLLPFRIRRGAAGDTVEESTFDRYAINGRVDAKRFKGEPR
jgi:hypothetical protein